MNLIKGMKLAELWSQFLRSDAGLVEKWQEHLQSKMGVREIDESISMLFHVLGAPPEDKFKWQCAKEFYDLAGFSVNIFTDQIAMQEMIADYEIDSTTKLAALWNADQNKRADTVSLILNACDDATILQMIEKAKRHKADWPPADAAKIVQILKDHKTAKHQSQSSASNVAPLLHSRSLGKRKLDSSVVSCSDTQEVKRAHPMTLRKKR